MWTKEVVVLSWGFSQQLDRRRALVNVEMVEAIDLYKMQLNHLDMSLSLLVYREGLRSRHCH